MENNDLLQAIGQMMDEKFKAELGPINHRLDTMQEDIAKIKITQENVTNKNIQLLFEGQKDTLRKFKQLDSIAEKVEDIQTTVEVLKALSVKK